jgi:hypothetical protein
VTMLQWPTKDPDEVLDYQLDWAKAGESRLEDGETLVDSDFSIVSGTVVIDSSDFAPSGLATVWLSGGAAGEKCIILNRVTTSADRTYDQSVTLRIRSK